MSGNSDTVHHGTGDLSLMLSEPYMGLKQPFLPTAELLGVFMAKPAELSWYLQVWEGGKASEVAEVGAGTHPSMVVLTSLLQHLKYWSEVPDFRAFTGDFTFLWVTLSSLSYLRTDTNWIKWWSCSALPAVFPGSQMFSRATGKMIHELGMREEGWGCGRRSAGVGGAGMLFPAPQRYKYKFCTNSVQIHFIWNQNAAIGVEIPLFIFNVF